jgi:zinc-ribbon domain
MEWMQPNEQVVWTGQTQYGDRGWTGGLVVILFGGLFIAMGILGSVVILGVGVLIIIGGIGVTYQGVKQGGTRFYLTNFRLVRTKRGNIINQTSRQVFRGKSLSSFLRITQGPRRTAQDRAWQPIENVLVQILDPNTGNVLMNLGWIPAPSVQALETVGQTFYCQYCGRQNDPSNRTCSECGANL